MKRFILLTAVILFSLIVFAQQPAPAPPMQHAPGAMGMPHPEPAPGPMPFMGMPDMGHFMPPGMNLDQFWKNPEMVNELHLTDAQIKQLEQASLQQHLALIDNFADGMKAYVRLRALLDAGQFDQAAAGQQVDALAAAASRLVKDFGQSVIATRQILTADQWQKLHQMRARRQMPHPMHMMGPQTRPAQPARPEAERRPM